MKIFLIHGSFGNPKENWLPWLKKQFVNLGHEVYVPKFPVEDYEKFSKKVEKNPKTIAENQNLQNWRKVFKRFENRIDENTVFIGHSLGPAFILRVLESINKRVKAAILVSGFLGRIGIPVFDIVNSTFVDTPFNWSKIKENCREFYVISSDNDPYVPFSQTQNLKNEINNYLQTEGKILSNYLNVKLILVKGGKHLNESAGFKKFLSPLNIVNEIVLRGQKNPVYF